ncbi:hypothetical protein BJX63DRAFT_72905 [Aspergillus granulosus]|uniref:Uncharacterized protein n=1 Tax=Aspergillus granulosus TaxID=176169 RepID=A0ABR4HSA2_9EURO
MGDICGSGVLISSTLSQRGEKAKWNIMRELALQQRISRIHWNPLLSLLPRPPFQNLSLSSSSTPLCASLCLGIEFQAEFYGDVRYDSKGMLVIDRKKRPWDAGDVEKHVRQHLDEQFVTRVESLKTY